jgi:hypothetical protein
MGIESNGGGKGLFGAGRLADRRPGLAIGVVRRRKLRRAPAGLACGAERGLVVAEREKRDGGVQERAGIVAGRRLRLSEALERFCMTARGLERNAELKFCLRVVLVALARLAQEPDRRRDVVRPQRLDAAAKEADGFAQC